MNAVGVLDKGFVTAAEPVMEQRLSLNVTLLTLLSLPAPCLAVCEGMTIVEVYHFAEWIL